MTILIGVIVPEGIAIAADSLMRATFLTECKGEGLFPVDPPGDPALLAEKDRTVLTVSSSAHKLFVVRDRFVLGVGGDLAPGEGLGVIEGFARSPASNVPTAPEFITGLMRALQSLPHVGMGEGMLVAGPDESGSPAAYAVTVRPTAQVQRIPGRGGVVMLGYKEIAGRLLRDVAIPFNVLSLQDAVDFARHLVNVVVVQQRFELAHKTVGGPIETAVATADGARWIARHEIVAHAVGAPPASVSEAA